MLTQDQAYEQAHKLLAEFINSTHCRNQADIRNLLMTVCNVAVQLDVAMMGRESGVRMAEEMVDMARQTDVPEIKVVRVGEGPTTIQ